MGIMNYFVFDDIDTRDYSGIYVSFSNVDKTPKRVYDVVGIPARNGAFYIDKQRFEDVEHSYYVIALTKAIGSQFINDLASKVGYHRLEDSFNTDEFYSAVFTSGADIKITSQRDKNTFKVTFTRKPQRWLTSGETAVSVADGGTLDNPTPFEAEPLLAVDGYGTIRFNGYEVEIENVTIGTIQIASKKQYSSGWGSGTQVFTQSLSMDSLNNGDNFTVNSSRLDIIHTGKINTSGTTITSVTNGTATSELRVSHFTISVFPDDVTFSKGTSSSFVVTLLYHLNYSGGGTYSDDITVTLTIGYDGNDTLTYTCVGTPIPTTSGTPIKNTFTVIMPDIFGDSTKSIITDTVYIDCDIGECWTIQSGNIVSLNSVISLGSDLPKLSSGTNTFTYDNTVTQLEVTPRWWKV